MGTQNQCNKIITGKYITTLIKGLKNHITYIEDQQYLNLNYNQFNEFQSGIEIFNSFFQRTSSHKQNILYVHQY
ncbi:unnamed protein product [Paramecium octaurelia]|uniref:Uncharacterized protein n=1 Tax=Paramecium octaurelia TaxID=43137 RepID=A0A8S1UNQ1_PAROT|nr:unnamed protein product [Paramecium octaurelia]